MLRRRPVVPRARASRTGARAGSCSAGVCVGLGFETKMGAALLVVPAIVAAWLWVAPRGRIAAVRQLLAGGAAMVVVGGAWPLLMMLTPASSRPWISGTSDNSILSLIFDYNGLGRLDGQAGGPQNMGGGGPGGGTTFGGASGPLRLLNEGARRAGRLAAGLRRRRDHRPRRRHAPAALGRPHRLAGRHRRRVPDDGRRVQLRPGDLPSLLRRAAGALHGGARRRRRRAGSCRAIAAAGLLAAAALAAGVATELLVLHKLPGQLDVAARGPARRRRGDSR